MPKPAELRNMLREYIRDHGLRYTLRRGAEKATQALLGSGDRIWRRRYPSAEELEAQRHNPPAAGLISAAVPVYNTDPVMLTALLDSFSAQTYADWEAVLYDGGGDRAETAEVLRAAAARDSRFRVIRGETNLGIAGNTNEAFRLCRGEYVALCDHDDLLRPDAFFRAAEAIVRDHPGMLYSDEDRITENGRHHMDPHDKPDFCPVNLISANYICHLTLIRRDLLILVGGLRSGFEGSQDHDLFLRVAEHTDRITHLPYTLYSWREVFSSMSHRNLQACLESGCRAVEEHQARLGVATEAHPVRREIRLWTETPREARVEALIFGPEEAVCRAGWQELDFRTMYGQAGQLTATLVVTDAENLYAALNEAAEASEADYLLLMDARLRGMNRHFLRELMMYARREDTAAVTPVLTDPRNHITHGGFYLAGGRAPVRCDNEGLYVTAGGDHDAMNRAHNVSALSVCAALIRREAFRPLPEEYRGGLGMAHWCLRQRASENRYCVFTPHATAVLPRDPLLLSGGRTEAADVTRFREAWGECLPDPCHRLKAPLI